MPRLQSVILELCRCRSNEAELLVWPNGSFLRGQAASNNPAVYSFAVLDSLMSLARSVSPNLGTVTFVGHSAGSQSLQRYAGANKLSIPAKYILANAGTYMYLTDQRVSARVLPSLNKTCPSPPGTVMCSLTAADFSQPWNGGEPSEGMPQPSKALPQGCMSLNLGGLSSKGLWLKLQAQRGLCAISDC